MSKISIGPGDHAELLAAAVGSRRIMRVVSFVGRASAGPVLHQFFTHGNTSKTQFKAVIDMQDGKNRTAEFSDTGAKVGQLPLSQLDTGASGHTCFALFTDTGT
jgi:hypothetical protein